MIGPDEISRSCLMISMLFGEPEAPPLILFTKQHYVPPPHPPRQQGSFFYEGTHLIRAKMLNEVEAFVLVSAGRSLLRRTRGRWTPGVLRICVHVGAIFFFFFFCRLSGASLSHPSAGPVPVAMATGPSSALRGCEGVCSHAFALCALRTFRISNIRVYDAFKHIFIVRFSYFSLFGCCWM